MAVETVRLEPQQGPQFDFLSSPADIVIYGGAAGGGKTYGLLLEPLRHRENNKFGAVIFRRTYPQITRLGGMWDESHNIYPYVGARAIRGRLQWIFPSSGRVEFAHMQYESDLQSYQGAQIPLLAFDQVEQFTERMFFFMLSRNRSISGVRPYVRATCNPDPDSWLVHFLEWWIGDDGYAREDRAGKIRYFVRAGDELVWADRPKGLARKASDGQSPKSVAFIPASVYDNQILLELDPGYLANLLSLPPVDRERLEKGNWLIRETAGTLFNRGWFELLDAVPAGGHMVRFWDLAATKKEFEGDDPAYTAGILMKELAEVYYIMDCIAVQEGPAAVDRSIRNMAKQDARKAERQGAEYAIRWEQEPGASGKRETARLTKMLAGYDCGGVRPQGDKVLRAKPLAAQAYAGNVKCLGRPWTERWLVHMHHQPNWSHNDIMDASSGAFNFLAQGEYQWAWGMVEE